MQRGVGVSNPQRSHAEIWPCGFLGRLRSRSSSVSGPPDRQADQCGVCSDEATVLIRQGEEGEALNLLVDLCSHVLTSGHELWVTTKITRSRIQAAKMSFLGRVAGLGHPSGQGQEFGYHQGQGEEPGQYLGDPGGVKKRGAAPS